MRKSTFVIALLFLVAIAWLGLQSRSPYAADAKPPVNGFEYVKHNWTELTPVEGRPDLLKELGDKGWEMCGVVPMHGYSEAAVYFKRPKQ